MFDFFHKNPSNPISKITKSPLKLHLTRHDPHNLELLTRFDLTSEIPETELEVAVFFPKSAQLGLSTKAELLSDFQSRFRLALPRNSEATSEAALTEALHRLQNAVTSEALFNDAKHLGAILGEVLRATLTKQKKNLSVARLGEWAQSLKNTERAIEEVRQYLESQTQGSSDVADPIDPILGLLVDYIDQNYQLYLGSLWTELDRVKRFPENQETPNQEAFQEASQMLARVQSGEVKRNKLAHLEDETERERYLLRSSQLKKFFQSDMFVEVTQKDLARRVSEPMAAGAATFAALWAALFQEISSPALVTVGFRGIFLICIGIAVYVLKDRLKDHGRAALTKHISKILPDKEHDLVAEGNPVGRIREWIKTPSKEQIARLHQARLNAALSEAEKHLPEDVLFYRRQIKIPKPGKPLALQQVLRICFDRYLKYLDDPYKSVTVMNPEGGFTTVKSHRVYHVHVVLHSNVNSKQPVVYRVVLDKNGIDRIELA